MHYSTLTEAEAIEIVIHTSWTYFLVYNTLSFLFRKQHCLGSLSFDVVNIEEEKNGRFFKH